MPSRGYEWSNVSGVSSYQCIQRRTCIEGNENHVPNAVLAVLEEDEVSRLNRRRDVSDPEVVAVHIVNPDGNSDHA